MRQWDFRDPQGWHSLLRQAGGREASGPEGTDAGSRLERFATSDIFQELAAATECHRDVAFLLPWPGKKLPAGFAQPPVVQGILDFLWQDNRGWHLLRLEPGPADTFPPGMVFWAHAARQLIGAWPEDAEVFSLADGATLRRPGSRLRLARELEPFRAALSALSEPRPSGSGASGTAP
jgi:hypothetical protein